MVTGYFYVNLVTIFLAMQPTSHPVSHVVLHPLILCP